MIDFYYQVKTPIDFWYNLRPKIKSLIPQLEILLIELTRIYYYTKNLNYYEFVNLII